MTIAIFYGLPVIQLVITYQQVLFSVKSVLNSLKPSDAIWHLGQHCSVQIIPHPIVTGESIVAWDESFIPVSSPIGQVPQNITKKRFSRRNSCIFLTK